MRTFCFEPLDTCSDMIIPLREEDSNKISKFQLTECRQIFLGILKEPFSDCLKIYFIPAFRDN